MQSSTNDQRFLDIHPTTSFARFNNQATTDPIIPGRAAAAFSANFPKSKAKALSLSYESIL